MASNSNLIDFTNEIELIEVTEDWVERNVEDRNQINSFENEVELIEVGEDWIDRCIEYDQDDQDQIDCFENDVELIEVGEDWVDRKIDNSEAGFEKGIEVIVCCVCLCFHV